MSSSNEFQVVKRTRKVQMVPHSGEEQVISSKTRTFGSTRAGGNANFSISSQGASVSGKRELNPEAFSYGEDRNQISGRGTASGRAQLGTSTQGFGYSTNTNGSRHSGNENSEMVTTKTTRTFNRFAHSGNEGMQTTTSETRTVGKFGRSSQNSREGSRDSQGGLQMSSRGRKIKIESESVTVPTA